MSVRDRQESERKANECISEAIVRGGQISVGERQESEGKTNECTREARE